MTEKKRLNLLKLEKFFAMYPCVLYFQYQAMSLTQWSILKRKIHDIGQVDLIVVKNTLMQHHLQTHVIPSRQNPSFAGPSFFVGCPDSSQIKDVLNIFRGYQNVICVGGLYTNSYLTHLDITALMALDASVYPSLITSFQSADRLCSTLQSGYDMHILRMPSHRLLQCLQALVIQKTGTQPSA